MKIIDHRLCQDDGTPYPFVDTPNKTTRALDPRYLVMHYTAGRSAESSVRYLALDAAKASAHLVIGRDGSITQMVPFNEIAWHAGKSSWENLSGLNSYSIGIELDNAGPLQRNAAGQWVAWFGDAYTDDQVIEAIHKHQTTPKGWQIYPAVQLEVAIEVGITLTDYYNFIDVLGHEDIAPGRKSDPGPAFPMETYRTHLFGRADMEQIDSDSSSVVGGEISYRTTSRLNIRSGPGSQYETLPGSPLPVGARLSISQSDSSWRLVKVLDTVNGVAGLEGWVHSDYIAPIR